jgi:flagellar assembly factor FliW
MISTRTAAGRASLQHSQQIEPMTESPPTEVPATPLDPSPTSGEDSSTPAIVIESSRFGALRVEPDAVIEFPQGLIGLESRRYTLLDRNPGSGFHWLHSLDDPGLALPVVDPREFFRPFTFVPADEDRELIGADDLSAVQLWVTVRAAPDPRDFVVNLRAPIVVWERRGHQVLNSAPGAELQVHLFAFTEQPD